MVAITEQGLLKQISEGVASNLEKHPCSWFAEQPRLYALRSLQAYCLRLTQSQLLELGDIKRRKASSSARRAAEEEKLRQEIKNLHRQTRDGRAHASEERAWLQSDEYAFLQTRRAKAEAAARSLHSDGSGADEGNVRKAARIFKG